MSYCKDIVESKKTRTKRYNRYRVKLSTTRKN